MTVLSRRGYLGIAIFHGAALMFQLLLTRLFSITIHYHFAFMVLCLVMLGLSVAGLMVHFASKTLRVESAGGYLGWICAGAGLASLAAVMAYLHHRPDVWELNAIGVSRLTITLLLFVGPAILMGLAGSLLFFYFPDQAGRIYFADLVGAGLGCVLMVQLSKVLSVLDQFFLVSALMALGGWLMASGRTAWRACMAVLAISLGLFFSQQGMPILKIRYNKSGDFSPENKVIIERWNPISRVTVRPETYFEITPLGPDTNAKGERGFHFPDAYWIDQDSSAGTPIFPWSATPREKSHLQSIIHGFSYHLSPRENVFVLGIGGGKDVMTALTFGARRVDAVEINPSIVDVMRKDLSWFVSDLLDDPRVNAGVAEGRSALLGTDRRYDQIQLTFIDSFSSTLAGYFAMVENHLYTLEGFDTYFDRLSENGVLSILWWNQPVVPMILSRIYLTGCEVLRKRGIEDPTRHILFVSDGRILGNILFRLEPWTPEEIARARQLAGQMQLVVEALPDQLPPPDKFMRHVVLASRPGGDLKGFLKSLPFDISPVTDDRPYVYFFQKPDNPFGKGLHPYLMPNFLASQALHLLIFMLTVLCVILVCVPMLGMMLRERRKVLREIPAGRVGWSLLYFTGLGAGYLALEISLIHKFIVFLGHPLYATSVVLASILLASGLGAAAMTRWGPRGGSRRWRAAAFALLAILVLAAASALGMSSLLEAARPWPLGIRITMAVVITAVFGALMGIPFPSGIELLSQRWPKAAHPLSPWLWAVNGAAGTFASAFQILLSIYFGFTACLAAGALYYGLALGAGWRWFRPDPLKTPSPTIPAEEPAPQNTP
jgi:spermidine synthase